MLCIFFIFLFLKFFMKWLKFINQTKRKGLSWWPQKYNTTKMLITDPTLQTQPKTKTSRFFYIWGTSTSIWWWKNSPLESQKRGGVMHKGFHGLRQPIYQLSAQLFHNLDFSFADLYEVAKVNTYAEKNSYHKRPWL